MKPDAFTNTPEDAAAYEAARGRAEWIDDRPTRAELEADDFDDWAWAQEQQRTRPDPWGDPPVTPRERLTVTSEPPF